MTGQENVRDQCCGRSAGAVNTRGRNVWGEARTQGKEHGIWNTYWVVMGGLDLANCELRRRLGTVELRL